MVIDKGKNCQESKNVMQFEHHGECVVEAVDVLCALWRTRSDVKARIEA